MGATGFLVLPVLLLGSCLGPGQFSTGASAAQSLAQARADLYAAMDDTQALLGGDWDNLDDPNSRGCALRGGSGRTYSALRLAPMVVDSSAAEAAVIDAWEGSGYTVERTEIGPVSQLIGTNQVDGLLIFRLSDRAMTLQGESTCHRG